MKTSKAVNKPGKASGDKEAIKRRNVSRIKTGPGEDEVREKAREIYNQRIDRGERGTAVDDWHQAEEYFRTSGD